MNNGNLNLPNQILVISISQTQTKFPKMQAVRTEEKPATTTRPQKLRDKKVRDLITDKRRLVEVPYTASLADTMNALLANRVVAVPVAAPPGHWIGAGGSMILESDKQTGAARKHYIGMVTMLDVLAHIAGNYGGAAEGGELERQMQVPVSSIIGQCLESLSLWTLNSNTDITDCMEVLSKGIHRALVPIDSHMENIAAGVELMDSASSYRMVTQMDVLKFLKANVNDYELRGLLECPVRELGAMIDIVFGVSDKTKVMDAIKCMNTASLNAVPIVESTHEEDHGQLINGKDKKLVGTFSTTDLRGCPIPLLQSCLQMNVVDFINRLSGVPLYEASGLRNSTKELITCRPESLLGEVVDKVVNNHVHRAWVVNELGLLVGLISLTDIIRVTRVWLLSEADE